MDLRKVKKLIELLEDSALVEMEITEGENTIRLSRASQPANLVAQQLSIPSAAPSTAFASPPAQQSEAVSAIDTASVQNGTPIESPMVGTFYDASSPDVAPYVQVGSKVKVGDVLCIIEAMKTFNQLEAEVSGTIKAIYKSTGEPVEFGEPLFLID